MNADSAPPRTPSGTLTARALRKAVLRIGLVSIAAGVISYTINHRQITEGVSEQLRLSTHERLRREALPFIEIQTRNANAVREFMELVQNKARRAELLRDFDLFFILRKDGAWVSRDALYDGAPLADGRVFRHLTAVLVPGVPLTEDLKVRLAASVTIVENYGNSGEGRHLDFGLIFPEGGLTLYWPGERYCTGLEFSGPKAFRMRDHDWFSIGFTAPGPGHARTRMFLDTPSGSWLVSNVGRCAPLPGGSQPVSSITDLSLAGLMERAAKPGIPGTDTVILIADAEGTLIFHPELRAQIQKSDGRASAVSTRDAEMTAVLKAASAPEVRDGAPVILDTPERLVACGVIPGTDWILAVRHPKALMRPAILSNLGIVAAVGLATLLVELFLLRSILKNQVAAPLSQLIRAARRLGDAGSGFDTGALPPDTGDEVGELSESFRKMAERLRDSFTHTKAEEEKLRAVLDTSPLPISWARADGAIEFWNRKAHELFGYAPEEIDTMEKWFLKAYPDPGYRRSVIENWNTPAADTGVQRGVFNVTAKDGRTLVVEIIGTRCGDLTLAMFNDITASRRAEEELRRHRDNLGELVAERTAELTRTNAALETTVRELGLKRYMLDNATTAVYLIDARGDLIYVNECAAGYAGYTREELTGRHVSLLNHAITTELWAERWNKVHSLPAGELLAVTMTHHRKDGTTYPIEILAHHITHEGRDYQLSMGVDITARKAAEENILQTEARLDQALSLTRSGYWSVVLDGSTHYTSSARAAALFGDTPNPEWRYSLADWRACIEAVSPEIANETGEKFLKACSGETPFYDTTYPYKRPSDGRVVWLHNLGVIIRDKPDRPPEMYGVCQDVTEIIEAKRELEEARQTAERANRLKSEFLANMSHEIRTPMNAILGYAQLMQRDAELPESQRKRIETINHAGEHLLALINDILEMSKIEAGRITLNEAPFDLRGLLEGLVELYGARARAKGLTLELLAQADLPHHIVSDEGKLRQSLLNLLGNAVKFTKDGGVTLTASAATTGDGRLALTFTVTDTGPGIAPEEIKKLFRPFVQSAAGISAGGTGLGLAISRRYARMLGGDITVRSAPGEGAAFTLTLVASPTDEAPLTKTKAPSISRLAPGQSPVRVLAVDDVDLNRELLSSLLTTIGFETRIACDGAEAVEVFHTWRPHAVIMDMRMPVMDGYEANRRIKATPEGRAAFILALTASAFEEEKAAVLASGADAFMRKPFNQDELLALLGERLGLRYEFSDTHGGKSPVTTSGQEPDFSALPEPLRESLRIACEGADYEKLVELCAGMGTLYPGQAERLRERTDAFDYESITRLITPAN